MVQKRCSRPEVMCKPFESEELDPADNSPTAAKRSKSDTASRVTPGTGKQRKKGRKPDQVLAGMILERTNRADSCQSHAAGACLTPLELIILAFLRWRAICQRSKIRHSAFLVEDDVTTPKTGCHTLEVRTVRWTVRPVAFSQGRKRQNWLGQHSDCSDSPGSVGATGWSSRNQGLVSSTQPPIQEPWTVCSLTAPAKKSNLSSEE